MQARDVMTPIVITVRPHWPARAAAAQLVAHGLAALPVTDAEGTLQGVVTESDLLRVCAARPTTDPAVRDVMRTVGGLPPDATLAEVTARLVGTDVPSVPVVDDGRLVGSVGRRDLLRALAGGTRTGLAVTT